jgi:hypothetical protein
LVELQKRIKNASLDYLNLPVRDKLRKFRTKIFNRTGFRVKLRNNYTAVVKFTQNQTIETFRGFKKTKNKNNQFGNIDLYLGYLSNKFEQDFAFDTGYEADDESELNDHASSTRKFSNGSFVFTGGDILETVPHLTKKSLTNYFGVVGFTEEPKSDVLVSINNVEECAERSDDIVNKIDVFTDCEVLAIDEDYSGTSLRSLNNFNYFENAYTTDLDNTDEVSIDSYTRLVETNPTVRDVMENLYETFQQTFSTNVTLLVDNKPLRHFLNYKLLLKMHNPRSKKKYYR